jgi:hypothetical protein
VAAALGKSLSAISHEVTTRCNPTFARAFALYLALDAPNTSGRAFAEAVQEARELRDLITAETATIIARGIFLLDREDELEGAENRSAKGGRGYAEALRAEGWAQIELAGIIDELEHRAVDLLGLYRSKVRS